MRYRKTFTEAIKEVWAKAAKKKEEEKVKQIIPGIPGF